MSDSIKIGASNPNSIMFSKFNKHTILTTGYHSERIENKYPIDFRTWLVNNNAGHDIEVTENTIKIKKFRANTWILKSNYNNGNARLADITRISREIMGDIKGLDDNIRLFALDEGHTIDNLTWSPYTEQNYFDNSVTAKYLGLQFYFCNNYRDNNDIYNKLLNTTADVNQHINYWFRSLGLSLSSYDLFKDDNILSGDFKIGNNSHIVVHDKKYEWLLPELIDVALPNWSDNYQLCIGIYTNTDYVDTTQVIDISANPIIIKIYHSYPIAIQSKECWKVYKGANVFYNKQKTFENLYIKYGYAKRDTDRPELNRYIVSNDGKLNDDNTWFPAISQQDLNEYINNDAYISWRMKFPDDDGSLDSLIGAIRSFYDNYGIQNPNHLIELFKGISRAPTGISIKIKNSSDSMNFISTFENSKIDTVRLFINTQLSNNDSQPCNLTKIFKDCEYFRFLYVYGGTIYAYNIEYAFAKVGYKTGGIDDNANETSTSIEFDKIDITEMNAPHITMLNSLLYGADVCTGLCVKAAHAFEDAVINTIYTRDINVFNSVVLAPNATKMFNNAKCNYVKLDLDLKYVDPAVGAEKIFNFAKCPKRIAIDNLNHGNWYLDGSGVGIQNHGNLADIDNNDILNIFDGLVDLNNYDVNLNTKTINNCFEYWQNRDGYKYLTVYKFTESDTQEDSFYYSVPQGSLNGINIELMIMGIDDSDYKLQVTTIDNGVTNVIDITSDGNNTYVASDYIGFKAVFIGQGERTENNIMIMIASNSYNSANPKVNTAELHVPKKWNDDGNITNQMLLDANAKNWHIFVEGTELIPSNP